MDAPATDTAIRLSIVVDAPIETAFSVFTDGLGTWFPPEYNLLEPTPASCLTEQTRTSLC